MGKKYIVELKKNETLYKAATRESDGTAYVCSAIGTPYTEPDMEQVKEEAYEKGYETAKHECEDCSKQAYTDTLRMDVYQKGLSDAWEAARKIGSNSMCSLKEIGFDFGQCVVNDYNPSWFVVKNYSASECIEKLRQYEQKQEKKDGVWIASGTWFVSEANEPSVDTILICSKCGYAVKIKPHETPALNFCPKCGDCKKPKEEES